VSDVGILRDVTLRAQWITKFTLHGGDMEKKFLYSENAERCSTNAVCEALQTKDMYWLDRMKAGVEVNSVKSRETLNQVQQDSLSLFNDLSKP
jgi:hypothetical protein